MNYIISQYLVFEKNDQGGILPETRWSRRARLYEEGHTEAVSNWKKYNKDRISLEELTKALQNNGETITDNAERQKVADEVLKDASERAKDYGNQIVANTRTLTDFKNEYGLEDPNKEIAPNWSTDLKGMASSFLTSLGNMAISTIEGIIVEKGLSLLINGIDHIVYSQQYAIEAGQEAADTINEQNEAYNNQKTSLNELTTKYSELSKGVQITGNTIKNVSLSDDQYQDFLSTSNQIADVAPSLTRTWDAQGNAILSAGTNVTALNKQVSDYLKLQRSLTYYDARDNIEDQYNGYIASKDEAKETLKG